MQCWNTVLWYTELELINVPLHHSNSVMIGLFGHKRGKFHMRTYRLSMQVNKSFLEIRVMLVCIITWFNLNTLFVCIIFNRYTGCMVRVLEAIYIHVRSTYNTVCNR